MEPALCDNKPQCIDGSDEQRCPALKLKGQSSGHLPIIIDFHQRGDLAIRSLRNDQVSEDISCPETHFWCPAKDFCLPVFVRCNGVYDCPSREDEDGCDVYTCPGFYRCRASKVCVHETHVCDDWPLCPQRDDELFCGQQCPSQCTCHGLAFFCSQAFNARAFPDLRFLDVRGSGMNMHQLVDNHMLIHLSLAKCSMKAMISSIFHNLNSLDISDNLLTEVSGLHFRGMPQLTVLFLAGNPLTSVFAFSNGSDFVVHKVHTLDLSHVRIQSVNSSLFSVFPSIHSLNLSNSGVKFLHWHTSQLPAASLQKLDLRGCLIEAFPHDVLKGFLHLQLLFADNFKLCCPPILPPGFDLNYCYTAPDDVSSCDNLLGSVTYRSVVAVLATLALLGNIVSLSLRVCVGNTWQLSNGGVVLTHLSVADLGTGLYLATLGLADRLVAGHYVWHDESWRRGAVCRLAGVLALSCRHATTLSVTILTLDRCLHRFFTSRLLLSPSKVKVMCVLVWVFSLLLVAVPLTAQWQIVGQQALCVPLPHRQNDSPTSHYTYAVQVLFPFVMFGLCCVCEVVTGLCSKVTHSSILTKAPCSKDFQFVVFGSLASGFLYTIACLVPTDSLTDGQRATHTALVYYGSVISCAMNPYLHLHGLRAEGRKRIKEKRLMMIVNRTRV